MATIELQINPWTGKIRVRGCPFPNGQYLSLSESSMRKALHLVGMLSPCERICDALMSKSLIHAWFAEEGLFTHGAVLPYTFRQAFDGSQPLRSAKSTYGFVLLICSTRRCLQC
jgi:hypothetical protein